MVEEKFYRKYFINEDGIPDFQDIDWETGNIYVSARIIYKSPCTNTWHVVTDKTSKVKLYTTTQFVISKTYAATITGDSSFHVIKARSQYGHDSFSIYLPPQTTHAVNTLPLKDYSIVSFPQLNEYKKVIYYSHTNNINTNKMREYVASALKRARAWNREIKYNVLYLEGEENKIVALKAASKETQKTIIAYFLFSPETKHLPYLLATELEDENKETFLHNKLIVALRYSGIACFNEIIRKIKNYV